MKPLYTNKQALIWLCAYSNDEPSEKRHAFAYIAFTMFVMGTYICFLSASIAYLIKFAMIDLNETLYVLIQILAALPMMKALIIMIFLRKKFAALFERLATIYDACNGNSLLFTPLSESCTCLSCVFRWKARFTPIFDWNEWKVWVDVENVHKICDLWIFCWYCIDGRDFSFDLLANQRRIWRENCIPSIQVLVSVNRIQRE